MKLRSHLTLLVAGGVVPVLAVAVVAGIVLAAAVKPDVALIDIGLARVDGYQAARRIRAATDGGSIRLVALTGYGQAEDRRRALDAGFDVHVTKPVLPERLAEIIAGRRRAKLVSAAAAS